jgi:hypothetical protein
MASAIQIPCITTPPRRSVNGARALTDRESADLWTSLAPPAEKDARKHRDPEPSGRPGCRVQVAGDRDDHLGYEEDGANEPPMRALLRSHAEGNVKPDPVDVPALPRVGTRAERALHDLLKLRFGLLLADGRDYDDPLMLSRSELVNAGIVSTLDGARRLLHRFEDWGVIHCVGEMPKQGKGNGTRLFLPGRGVTFDAGGE